MHKTPDTLKQFDRYVRCLTGASTSGLEFLVIQRSLHSSVFIRVIENRPQMAKEHVQTCCLPQSPDLSLTSLQFLLKRFSPKAPLEPVHVSVACRNLFGRLQSAIADVCRPLVTFRSASSLAGDGPGELHERSGSCESLKEFPAQTSESVASTCAELVEAA